MLLPAWNIKSAVPSQKNYKPSSQSQVEIARMVNGHQEIWLKVAAQFDVFTVNTQKWETISSSIENTALFVDKIFARGDGSIWGRITFSHLDQKPITNMPILGQFNENTRRFEIVENSPSISIDNTGNDYHWPEILIDSHDALWIVVEQEGIYRYNPDDRSTQKRAQLPKNFKVSQTVIGPNGTIYIEKYQWAGETRFRLPKNVLFQFAPESNQITPVSPPSEEWPFFSGMLIDSKGRLWLGSIGYQDPENNWHLIHSNPQKFFDVVDGGEYSYLWSPPLLMLESSNGLLWYRRWLDTDGLAEGTAWYNPETKEGCLISNQQANIIEDTEHQLWLVANEKLFEHQIN